MKCLIFALVLLSGTADAREPYMWGVGPSAGYAGSSWPDQMSLGLAAVAHHHRHLQYGLEADLGMGGGGLGVQGMFAIETFWPTPPMGFSLGGAVGGDAQFRRLRSGARQRTFGVPIHLRMGLYGSWDIYRVGAVVYAGPSLPVSRTGSEDSSFGPRVPIQFGMKFRVYWGDFTPPRKPRYFDDVRPAVDDKAP